MIQVLEKLKNLEEQVKEIKEKVEDMEVEVL